MIRTARLAIRPLAADDLAAIRSAYGDPETMVTMPWRLLDDESAAQAWLDDRLAEQRAESPGYYALENDVGELIGLCGFLPRGTQLEIGWVIRKPHWHQGFATEAASAVLALAGDRDVFATIRPSNRASMRVAEKIGLEFDREIVDEFGALLVYRLSPRAS